MGRGPPAGLLQPRAPLSAASITIGIDPVIDLGPVELAWHGLTIALGLLVGLAVARRRAPRDGVDPDSIGGAVTVIALAGIAGSRALYLLEHDPSALLRPGQWLASNGFSFYGAMIFAPLAVGVLIRSRGLPPRVLDTLAFAFPAAMAVGRLGDVINGEHHGPPTDLPWGIRYTHPEALTPDPAVAYHAGGLYEVLLALAMLAVIWPLAGRLRGPGDLLAAVVGLYASGRLLMFTWRSDSPDAVLGLDASQLISLLLMSVAAAWLILSARRRRLNRSHGRGSQSQQTADRQEHPWTSPPATPPS